jgi:uncharacterized protein YjiS (DUF1127 family)
MKRSDPTMSGPVPPRGAWDRAFATFRQWRSLSRSRRELAGFDEYQLRDIGVSRSQAAFESGKSFLQQ